nr:hypothetical protein [Kofleriaceae bacterium]
MMAVISFIAIGNAQTWQPPSVSARPRTLAVDHRVPAVLAPSPRRALARRLRRDCERRCSNDRPTCFYGSAEIASVALVAMNQTVRSIDTVLGSTNCLSATSATLAISADL